MLHPLQVAPTGDERGNGAFATELIAKGTYIGDYEGRLISEKEYWVAYPDGVVSGVG